MASKSLNVSLAAHKAAKLAATECDMTIQQWVEEAIAVHSGNTVDMTGDPLDLRREPIGDAQASKDRHPSRAGIHNL